MIKICILNVYFGRFKNYFDLWLYSCSQNPDIDFLIVTDNSLENLPCNVSTLKMSFEQFSKLASSKLEMQVRLDKPYKCCDFRPAYGLIFQDYLTDYDYWGHSDVDLIWGNLKYFFDKYELHKYDKFLHLGHLSLYRNTNEVNNYFRMPGSKLGSYVNVFSTSENLAFDEMSGIWSIIKSNNKPQFSKKIFADISSIYSRYRLTDVCFEDGYETTNYSKQIFYYKNGGVYRDYIKNGIKHTEEFIYIHFKQRPNFRVNFDINQCENFYITKNGFIPMHTEDNVFEYIKKYNYGSFLQDKYEYIKYLFGMYFRKLISKLK